MDLRSHKSLPAHPQSLDGTTTYQYQAYATSSFAQHSLLGAIATAQAIVLAVTKPFAAKFADVLGRAEAFALSVFFYVLGYIIIASCSNISTYAAGYVPRPYTPIGDAPLLTSLFSQRRDLLCRLRRAADPHPNCHRRLHHPAVAWSPLQLAVDLVSLPFFLASQRSWISSLITVSSRPLQVLRQCLCQRKHRAGYPRNLELALGLRTYLHWV